MAGTDLNSNNLLLCQANGESCQTLWKGRGAWIAWSGDESHIYFLRTENIPERGELWSISRDGSDERKITDLPQMALINPFFDVSGRDQVAWVQFQQGNRELWLLDLK